MDEIIIEQILPIEDKPVPKLPRTEIPDGENVLGETMQVPAARSKLQLATIMTMLYSSVFLAALDTTITATALPTISSYFNSSTGYTWIGSAYLLATAASMPSWGKISDLFGKKPALLMSLAIFFLGSLICGVSTSMSMLIAGRAAQGTGGGGIVILVNVCTSDLFSMRTRGMIFGFESLIWALAAAVGPLLGGAFSEFFDWRWCFYITLPFSALDFIFLSLFLHLDSPSTPIIVGLKAIDWIGSVTIVGVTLTLLLGLEFGGVIFPWNSVKVICLLVFGLAIGGCFLYNEAKFARYPVMPLRLFRSRSNVAALLVGFLHGVSYFAVSYYLPLYGQAVRGYSPLQSGIFVLPFEISLSISSSMSGTIMKITGRYLELIYLGLSLLAVSMGLLIHFTAIATPSFVFIIIQILAGAATGIMYPAPLIALQTGIQARDSATATSTFGFTRQLSTAISVVLGGVVFQNGMECHRESLQADVGSVALLFTGKEAAANVLSIQGLGEAEQMAVREAFAASLKQIWILFTCTAATGFICSVFIKRRNLSRVHEEVNIGLPEKTDEIMLEERRKDVAPEK